MFVKILFIEKPQQKSADDSITDDQWSLVIDGTTVKFDLNRVGQVNN